MFVVIIAWVTLLYVVGLEIALVATSIDRTEEESFALGRVAICPLWVKSGLSVPCHFMSALPPKADIKLTVWNVRLVPKADIQSSCPTTA